MTKKIVLILKYPSSPVVGLIYSLLLRTISNLFTKQLLFGRFFCWPIDWQRKRLWSHSTRENNTHNKNDLVASSGNLQNARVVYKRNNEQRTKLVQWKVFTKNKNQKRMRKKDRFYLNFNFENSTHAMLSSNCWIIEKYKVMLLNHFFGFVQWGTGGAHDLMFAGT